MRGSLPSVGEIRVYDQGGVWIVFACLSEDGPTRTCLSLAAKDVMPTVAAGNTFKLRDSSLWAELLEAERIA